MSQENVDDLMQLAKYYAQAEKDLDVQPWVYVSIEFKNTTGDRIRLFSYDLPRDIFERRRWVLRWREARLQCEHPKENVQSYFSFYDHRLGNNPCVTDDLRKLISAKAQVSKAQKRIDEYVAYQKESNMFFDENSDVDLLKAREKLARKVAGVQEAEERLVAKINQIKDYECEPHS